MGGTPRRRPQRRSACVRLRRTVLLGVRHAVLVVISVAMLVPFYWVLKTSLTGENIYAYPPHLIPRDANLFHYVDVWYFIPFPRYLLNSVVVSLLAVAAIWCSTRWPAMRWRRISPAGRR